MKNFKYKVFLTDTYNNLLEFESRGIEVNTRIKIVDRIYHPVNDVTLAFRLMTGRIESEYAP